MTWAKGRQLASVSRGSSSASYAYDMDGIRTSKTVNGVTTEFITQNGRVVRQSWSGNVLDFFYDSQQRPYAVTYKPADGAAATYYYITNLQGDVVALIDSSGSLAAEYTYNAWGAPLTMPYGGAGAGAVWPPIAELNPLRYRGYYYDAETGFYYVSSRYYDPEIGRWINADGFVSTGQGILGNNMFAYCLNNPVNYEDSDGEMAAAAGALAWGAAAGGANAWNPAGWIILGATAIAAIGILVIPWDSVGQSISKGWNEVKSSARSASISRSISKAVSKAKTKIRNEKRRYDYWIAAYVEYGDGRGTYIPTTPLSYTRATSYVRGGGSVFADSRNNAYKLAKAVGGGTPARDSAHGELGYWRHYHATWGGKRIGGHVFYVA